MRDSEPSGQNRLLSIVMLLPFAALIFLSCRQVCAQAQSSENPSTYTISGTVVNSLTREPIGRALAYSADERYAAFTDDHGHFELTITSPTPDEMARFSEVVLQAKKPGFLPNQGADGRASIRPTTKEVTLSLIPEALIVGQVKFPSSETADQAQVVLYRREVRDGFGRWEQLTEVRTRSNGEYRFAELRPGQYKLFTAEAVDRDPLASAPGGPMYGFPPRFFAEARDFASADVIELHPGESFVANMAPDRQRYFEVKIPVMVPQPADWGVMVSVRAQGHRGPGFELGYDPNQHAIRGSLPNGTYMIEASSTGPAAATGAANITIANGPVFGPAIALTANPRIEVNIRTQISRQDGSQGMSAPTAQVMLQSAEEYSSERGVGNLYQSQNSNPLTLDGVKPGRYWVQLQSSWSNMYAASVTSGLTDLLRAPLVVPVGASVPPIEITLRDDSGEIEVTVEGAPEDPRGVTGSVSYSGPMPGQAFGMMGGIFVYGLPVGEGGTVKWFNGRSNGKYILQQAPPGDYRVMAFDSSQEFEWRNLAALQKYDSKGQVVHVTAGKTTQVTLRLSGGATGN